MDSHKQRGKQLTLAFSELWRILEACVASLDTGEIVCVLDALDECNADSRQTLIEKLQDFYFKPDLSSSRSRLKFLITSRPYDDLEESFYNFCGSSAYLRFDGDEMSEQISQEINLVIDVRVRDITRGFAEEDRRAISDRLRSMEHRTYLWLYLTLDIIKQSRSKFGKRSAVEELLSGLPKKVSDAYEKILSRSEDQALTKILLEIVLAAVRPLTVDEANTALTLASQKEPFNSHTKLESELWPTKDFGTTVRNLCGLFISVHDSKLSLIHQTAKEFLVDSEHKEGEWKGRFNMPDSHNTILRSCFHYILLPEFMTPLQDDSDNNPTNNYNDPPFTFFHYAAVHWPLHYTSQTHYGAANYGQKDPSEIALGLCDTKSKRNKNWSTFYRAMNLDFPGHTDPLIVSSYFGFETVVQRLLNSGKADVEAKDRYGRTPLWFAASGGHEATVKLLIEKGADVEAKDEDGRTSLWLAAYRGHDATVKLLVEKGADVEAKDRYGRTPLSLATEYGYEATVKLLLENGADVKAKDDRNSRTPLSLAAYSGHEATVKLLVEKGADVEAKDEDGRTPLSLAAYSGHEATVKLLVEKGADVEAKDEDGRTPLSLAASRGHEATVNLLESVSVP